jgi:hypothetical protein
VKSTVLVINDLGIRGWLLGQFILVVWAVDILSTSLKERPVLTAPSISSLPYSKRIKDLLIILLIVGVLTTFLEAFATRFWSILIDAGVTGVPNEISPDTNLGKRTYASRLAYEFIRDGTPQNLIIQNNPMPYLDRPSGLYGTRQMVIASRTAYGVPAQIYEEMSAAIARIFLAENVQDWIAVDEICNQYFIQAIVVNDTDPLWSSLPRLQKQRTPIYINQHYAIFSCG